MGSWEYCVNVRRYDTISCQPLPFDELLSGEAININEYLITYPHQINTNRKNYYIIHINYIPVLVLSGRSGDADLGPHIRTVQSSDTEAII